MAIATIKLDPKRIKRMCFVEGKSRTMATVKSSVGCDLICNASFYGTASNGVQTPVFHLKNEGVLISDAGWNGEGFSWNSLKLMEGNTLDFGMRVLGPTSTDQHDTNISGYTLLSDTRSMSTPLDTGIPSRLTRRGRTLIGLTNDGYIYIMVTSDGSTHAMTASQCRQEMYDAGCKYVVMLDGGGSSQCDFGDNGSVYSIRRVYNYLCIWLKTDEEMEEETEPEKEMKTLYRVQVGAYSIKTNAANARQTMINLGYSDAFISEDMVNGKLLYRVQVGAFSVKANAERLRDEIISKGINAFIKTVQIYA